METKMPTNVDDVQTELTEARKTLEKVDETLSNGCVNVQNVDTITINFPSAESCCASAKIHLQNKNERAVKKDKLYNGLDVAGKVIAVLSGLSIFVMIILILTGILTIGSISISNLFTVFSFTLFSGLISIGGAKIFSINASLKNKIDTDSAKLKQLIDNYIAEHVIVSHEICPFVFLADDEARKKYGINSNNEIAKIGEWCFSRPACPMIDKNGKVICKIAQDADGRTN